MQAPPEHHEPGAHSAFVVQTVAHLPALHANGAQSVPVASLAQIPRPSQVLPVTLVPVHEVAPHETPLA